MTGRDRPLDSDLRARPRKVARQIEARFREEARSFVPGGHRKLVLLVECAGQLREGTEHALDWVLEAPEIATARRAGDDLAGSPRRRRAMSDSRTALELAVTKVATRSGPQGVEWLLQRATDERVSVASRFRAQRTLVSIHPRELAQFGDAADFDPLFSYVDSVDGLLLDWLGDVLGIFGARFFDRLEERLAVPHPGRRLKFLRIACSFSEQGLRLRSPLRKAWEDGTREEREAAILTAGVFAPATLPLLIDALSDGDAGVRAVAAEAVERSIRMNASWADGIESATTRTESEQTSRTWLARHGVRALMALLRDPSTRVRAAVAMTLFELGRDAKPAREELSRASDDESRVVRYWARGALARIDAGPWSKLTEARTRRIELGEKPRELEDVEEAEFVQLLRRELSFPQEPAQRDSAEWREYSADRMNAARNLTLHALPQWMTAAEAGNLNAQKSLELLLDELEFQMRKAVAEAARDVAQESLVLELGPVLLEELGRGYLTLSTTEEAISRDEARKWLAGLGLRALPYYVSGLELWWDGRPECVMSIRRLGVGALPAAPAILSGWRWRGDDVGALEFESFWSEPAPGSVREGRGSRSEADSYGASALTRMGAGSLPWLLEAFDERDVRLRMRVSASLSNLPQLSAETLPALQRNLNDSSLFVRASAARAILLLEPGEALQTSAEQTLAELGLRHY